MSKKLYRSTRNQIIGGVCGGIGEYFNVDPVLIRLLWLVFIPIYGTGLLIYLIFVIVVPKRLDYNNYDEDEIIYESGQNKYYQYNQYGNENKRNNSDNMKIIGIILLVVGLILVGRQVFDYFDISIFKYIPFFNMKFIISIGIIVVGVYFLIKGLSDKDK